MMIRIPSGLRFWNWIVNVMVRACFAGSYPDCSVAHIWSFHGCLNHEKLHRIWFSPVQTAVKRSDMSRKEKSKLKTQSKLSVIRLELENAECRWYSALKPKCVSEKFKRIWVNTISHSDTFVSPKLQCYILWTTSILLGWYFQQLIMTLMFSFHILLAV